MLLIRGKFVFGHYYIVMFFLLCGEALIRSVLWYSGKIPSFLMKRYDLHEPLASELPPGPDMNAGSYNPPM